MSDNTTELKQYPITRNELIEKVIETRVSNFDSDDIDEALRYGRYGFTEFSNEELQQFALDMMMEEDGEEVQYVITDADTSKPDAETLVHELLAELKAAYQRLLYLAPEKYDDEEHEASWTRQLEKIDEVISRAEGK